MGNIVYDRQSHKAADICIVAQLNFTSRREDMQYCSALALAQHFAARGDIVTFLIVPDPNGDEPVPETVEQLRVSMFGNWLIHLKVLTASADIHPKLDQAAKCSISLYHHLRERNYDVAYISLQGGLPHFAVTAKNTGVFNNPPHLIVLAHEPTLWRRDAERKSVESKDDLTVSFMERTSVEQCDHLVVQSDSVSEWMKAKGWKVPKNTSVLQPLIRHDWQMLSTIPRLRPITEIVHIAGGDAKNNLSLFCDAIDGLAPSLPPDTCVTFLGQFGTIEGEHSGGMVLRRARNWPFRVRLLPFSSSQEICNYITTKLCLVVFSCSQAQIPLYLPMCIHNEIPFIATDVGGIPSLIKEDRRASVLCAPRAHDIGSTIRDALPTISDEKFVSALAYSDIQLAWDDFSRLLLSSKRPPKGSIRESMSPLVSIVLAHYERPEQVRHAIASVEHQDYKNIELVLVDDGSTSPESVKLIGELESKFAARDWRIVRQSNKYLGAARNAGIKAARGERILFLDDDNLLFPYAISTLVAAMDESGADICTTFSRYLYDKRYTPLDTKRGTIEYLPVGGPRDIALFNNPYGDANALIRRNVFDDVGYLNEQRGLSGSDWEFYLRADLAGKRIAVVPEALYWYRSDPEGMNRNVNWVSDRRQLIDTFKNTPASELGLLLELSAFQNLDWNEKSKNEWNLEFRVNDLDYRRLNDGEPNSVGNIELLSLIAARSGRPDTAVELAGCSNGDAFKERIGSIAGAYLERNALETDSLMLRETVIPIEKLRQAFIYPHKSRLPSGYANSPDQFFLEAIDSSFTLAMFKSACPAGTVSLSGWVFSPEDLVQPLEFMLLAIPAGANPVAAVEDSSADVAEGCSGWIRLSWPRSNRQIHAIFSRPAATALDVIIAVRLPESGDSGAPRAVFASLQGLTCRQGLDGPAVRHPRTSPPRDRRAPRALTEEELQSATLLTGYESDLPLLLFDRANGGIFLRPHQQGPVAAVLAGLFPPHATGVSALVEVAHDDASPFEFGLALLREGDDILWEKGVPINAAAFSGWVTVAEKFELKEVRLTARALSPEYMSICLMIRLPKGSSESPANAFWRRIILRWGD